jgi:hypothetical protein
MAGDAKVSGVALGSIAVGALFLYAGIKGKSIPAALQAVITGKSPATAAAANQITGTSAAALAASSASSVSDTASELSQTSSASATANQALARLSATISHPTWIVGQEWEDWVSLWNQESGWSNTVQNAGSGALGIAQALGHGTAGTGGKYGNEYGANYGLTTAEAIAANNGSPLPQIQWGMNYIAETYGSPSAAWAHEEANNWY